LALHFIQYGSLYYKSDPDVDVSQRSRVHFLDLETVPVACVLHGTYFWEDELELERDSMEVIRGVHLHILFPAPLDPLALYPKAISKISPP
jgi:hypothetical protein